jgi:hypothetical protein
MSNYGSNMFGALMTLTDSVVSLKAALHGWEWFGYVSTAIVFLGCVGEFVAEFTSIFKSKEAQSKLARLSLIVLIFGIAGELLSAVRTSQLSGQLISNIEERAGDAEQKAGEANERASLDEKEAAQLRLEAEQEKLARLGLEKYVAARTVDGKQTTLLIERLTPLKGKRLICSILLTEGEAAGFGSVICSIMKLAGLSVEDQPVLVFGGIQAGLSITAGPNRTRDAHTLFEALKDAGLMKAPLGLNTSDRPDDLKLFIGPKH